MNMENEKKWFIYIGDHHEGPFSVEEVSEKKKSYEVNNESYVWCEGMNDWVMLSEVKELTLEPKILPTLKISSPPQPASLKSTSFHSTVTHSVSGQTGLTQSKPLAKSVGGSKKRSLPIYLFLSLFVIFTLSLGALSALSRFASEELHAKLRPTLSLLVEKVPAIQSLFHLVPVMNDITPEEQTELEQARIGTPESGVKIALASSQSDSNRPFFYVSTNLPDRIKLDVYLVGISETLLNKLQFAGQNSATPFKGFGKTEVFTADGAQLIPKGEYQVVVVESLEQEESVKTQIANFQSVKAIGKLPVTVPQNSHFAVLKSYFLGGPRDQVYLTRLKQFHEKIKQNAEREVQELRQYSDTLNSQYSNLTTEFNRIYQTKKMPPSLKLAWKKDADTWQQINGQLEQTVQTWSKETIQNEFFYGKMYSLVKSAYESTKALFTLENSYVENPKDHASFEVQHGKLLSETRDALELLRTKMDLILKAPKTPSGLPTRVEL